MPYTPPTTSPSPSQPVTPGEYPVPREDVRNTRPTGHSPAIHISSYKRSPQFHSTTAQNKKGTNLKHSSSIKACPAARSRDKNVPNGAIVSPPDSQASDDDEPTPQPSASRHVENLQELQKAIREIPHFQSDSRQNSLDLDNATPASTKDLNTYSRLLREHTGERLNKRFPEFKLGSDVDVDSVASYSASDSETGPDQQAPAMLRKKSGELVKSSLKVPHAVRKRPTSMPSTPTHLPKYVHFDSKLVHVRHFLQAENPAAVSVKSSPVDGHTLHKEFPFFSRPKEAESLELSLPNFPPLSEHRTHGMVWVRKVSLSADCRYLLGEVVVKNLAFQKWVAVRYTMDNWRIVSEVSASYSQSHDHNGEGLDRDIFTFAIKISDFGNLEDKMIRFAVRYNVTGNELWDNNDSKNYEVRLLPKQSNASTNSSSAPVIDVMRDSLEEDPFVTEETSPVSSLSFFKSPIAAPRHAKGNDGNEKLFSSRYDFGASLTAAIQAASRSDGPSGESDKSSENDDQNRHSKFVPQIVMSSTSPGNSPPSDKPTASLSVASSSGGHSRSHSDPNYFASAMAHERMSKQVVEDGDSQPKALPKDMPVRGSANDLRSDKPAINSSLYREFLNEYCFVRVYPKNH